MLLIPRGCSHSSLTCRPANNSQGNAVHVSPHRQRLLLHLPRKRVGKQPRRWLYQILLWIGFIVGVAWIIFNFIPGVPVAQPLMVNGVVIGGTRYGASTTTTTTTTTKQTFTSA